MNGKYAQYRKIKADRVYKTLGKMSVGRVVLGVALLILVLFMTGTVSQFFAGRGNFEAAEQCMVFPKWMDTYKPEYAAYFRAGVHYNAGEFDEALELLESVEEYEPALEMRSSAAVRQAEKLMDEGSQEEAARLLEGVDAETLSEEDSKLYIDIIAHMKPLE